MIGQTISHYKILEKLGQGGMGVVYKAEDLTLDRHVALKFLPAGFESDENAKERFIREAKAASALNHSNIAVVHEIDQAPDGRLFIVMAYYDGDTLKARLDRGTVPVDEALGIISQVASGLAKAHEKNILHRDVKPANVLLTDDGEAKLADFGLAKLRGRETLTETGMTLGTLAYMSPEQARGDELDRRSDVFSLGVVLYELLTGHLPFEAEQQAALLYRIVNDKPEPLVKHRPELDQDLQHIVDRALAKDLEDRYASAQALLEDLKSLQAGRQIARLPRERRWVRAKTLFWAGFVAVISIVLYGISTRLQIPPSDRLVITSLAVLPFRNAITDPEQAFLANGITDELIARLARIGSIRVIARRSVMGYANTDKSLSEIARELDVDALVEGSVKIVDDRLRATVELANPNESDALWGDTFDRSLSDILALPAEMALAIAQAAGIAVSTSQQSRMSGAPQVDPAVYKAYRTGLRAMEDFSDEAWQKGIKYFNEAIDLDPTFAPAYVGLSRCYGFMGWVDPNPDYDAMQKAAALEAIELDESLADGHVALADYYYRKSFDWGAAEEAFRRALELEPASAYAHLEYGNFLILAGRSDEGIEHLIKSKELNPLSLEANRELGLGYLNARRYDEAIEYLVNMRGVFPDYIYTEWFLAGCYSGKGLHEKAIATIENAAIGGSENVLKAMSPDIYARAGRVDEALDILEARKETASSEFDVLFGEARVFAILGRYDEAFAAAEKLYEGSPIGLLYLNIDPLPHEFRADQRYQDLLSRVGLGNHVPDIESE